MNDEQITRTFRTRIAITLGALTIGFIALGLLATANASEPCDPTDAIFADGFEFIPPPWWDCWPHLTPPPPGWVCP